MSAPGFREALRVWCRVALLSFGGPAGQIAVMHRIVVDEKRWIGERRFLHALNFCMLLPGPEAQQLAIYLGWLLHGWRGGLAAGTLFVLPGFIAILGLSVLYAGHQGTLLVTALFFGLKPAVVAVVVEALVRLGRRALRGAPMVLLALASFVAMFLFRVPFVAILVGAAAVGLVLWRGRPLSGESKGAGADAADPPEPAMASGAIRIARRTLPQTLAIALCGLILWWAPVLLLALAPGSPQVLVTLGLFFGKVAVLSFGGAYAVLSYVGQEAVTTFGWLRPAEMLDGLGMAETTPGPLIMVVQFVGFMAAFRNAAPLEPLWAGVAGSLVVTWMTFVPCFLWIFVGAPYVERLRGIAALSAALSAITAAVVGVIMNLVVWFGLHVLFARVSEVRWGAARLLVPDPASVSPISVLIAGGALLALLRLRWGLMRTLLAGVAVGALWVVLQGR